MIGVVLLVLLVVWFLWRRNRRRSELAGRIATRPTFMVEPPARRVGSRKSELL